MSVGESSGRRPPWSGDAGAGRLFSAVRGACAEVEGLPSSLAVGLWTALEILGEGPLRRPSHGPALPRRGRGGPRCPARVDRPLGALLRDAAANDPRASRPPSFLAPFLIGGVRFQIARLVLAGEGSELLRLLPGTLEALLAYYFEPGEPRRLARAALEKCG